MPTRRLAGYTQTYLRWEEAYKGYGGLKGSRLSFFLERTPRTASDCEARNRSVGLLPAWKQRVYPGLSLNGRAVTAGQR